MSVNGEITAVRISRKSSLSEPRNDIADHDFRTVRDEERRSRPPTGRQHNRPKTGRPSKNPNADKNPDSMLRADSDQIDLERLLHSMLDINDNKTKGSARTERPFSAHQIGSFDDRDVASVDSYGRAKPRIRPFSAQVQAQTRTNYSFSNDKVKEIDRENQRLLRELMRNEGKKGHGSKQPVFVKKAEPLKVKSSAALNRIRYQQQVERENLAILRRLEKVGPTKDLSREHLLREHFRQEQLATNVSRSKRRPASAGKIGISRKSNSLNDLRIIDNESVASSRVSAPGRNRTGSSRRPISAKNGTLSKGVVDNRPVWESGW